MEGVGYPSARPGPPQCEEEMGQTQVRGGGGGQRWSAMHAPGVGTPVWGWCRAVSALVSPPERVDWLHGRGLGCLWSLGGR